MMCILVVLLAGVEADIDRAEAAVLPGGLRTTLLVPLTVDADGLILPGEAASMAFVGGMSNWRSSAIACTANGIT
jgi:hypothetical protein